MTQQQKYTTKQQKYTTKQQKYTMKKQKIHNSTLHKYMTQQLKY